MPERLHVPLPLSDVAEDANLPMFGLVLPFRLASVPFGSGKSFNSKRDRACHLRLVLLA
jgi:hypothetical protein